MRYLPLTADEQKKILKTCGVDSFDALVSTIPPSLRVKGLLDLEPALCESELIEHIQALAKNVEAAKMQSHLGQGVYDHSWPVVIDQIQNRGEFLTAYTPYQPEISQGTLQMIFEFQSMVANLLGMEVANASLYDGATAVVEAVLMAARLKSAKSGTVYVNEGMYSRTREVLETYLIPLGFKLETWWADPKTFLSKASDLPTDASTVAVVLQSPNKWGLIEDWSELNKASQATATKSVAYVSHPQALALFEDPGEAKVDIVASEGQSFGIPVGFGGPHLGLFACRKADVRQMPGRVVGATVDSRGQQAFCVTLSTREQHIRREKATSNICSNQNLMALRATMYLSLMGPTGLKKVADLCRARAHYARNKLSQAFAKSYPELKVLEGDCYNEITLLVPPKRSLWLDDLMLRLEKENILAGVKISVPGASGFVSGLAMAFTERHKTQDIDRLINRLTQSDGVSK